ncbi:MAG: hypothetical protein JNM41_14235 [Flavipsychrobacter sp.]|nr:hypothetical protein [Flavipsychrobacter sp.]
MNNPYKILGVSQDADKTEIKRAQLVAMKERKFALQEIHKAVRELLEPAKRLAADFMYPGNIKVKRPQKIVIEIASKNIDLQSINENTFDSLK